MRLICLTAAAWLAVGCSRAIAPLIVPEESTVALTGGPNTSMIYLARTSAGVVAIDLGWWGHERALSRALGTLGATPSDVSDVFLTHSHRDHVSAWPVVRHARVYVAASERRHLIGELPHGGWIPRTADRIKPGRLPRDREIDVHTFEQDTTFVLGTDTLRAYIVVGHTAGSAVYLFRGVLFLGDAVTYRPWSGFAPAKRGFSDDTRAAAINLTLLWPRLPPGAVRFACTAHAQCAPFSQRFLDALHR